MKRRDLLLGTAAAVNLPAIGQASSAGITRDEILLGQTADFSASRALVSKAYSEGAALHFDEVNKEGGIFGRKIRVAQRDDAYDTERALVNARELWQDNKVFALVHAVGTAITDKLLPFVDEAALPLIHPLTGADYVRPPLRRSEQTFFLRASYGREVELIVSQLRTVGIRRIALVHEDEPFGHSVRDGVQRAMHTAGLALSATGVMPANRPDEVDAAVAAIAQARPDAVIVGSAGPSVERFIQACLDRGVRSRYYCLSVSNADRLHKALGRHSEGIVIAQVMPAVQTSNLPVVRDFRRATTARGLSATAFGLEGYISARLIVDALRRAGSLPSRASFMAALNSAALSEIGGYPLRYRGDARQGSPFAELAMIGAGGKLRL